MNISLYIRKLKFSSIERNVPNISEQNAEFLQNLIREKNPKHILEIGTANGYSTLQFASMLLEKSPPEKGEWEGVTQNKDSSHVTPPNLPFSREEWTITTIEYAWNAHIEAVEHFRNCKVKNIHAVWGDAKAVIPTLANEYFDFVFIDAMKREYLDYLLLSLPKCTPDALIVIDDVEKFASKMENLYDWLWDKEIPYHIEKTDIDDSIMILERRDFPQ
jgi:predicted O-methyltransferase YrrM